jgi:ketosteroid isomerase-like protein
MSENTDLVRRTVDAINRADFDAVVDAMTDDFELDFSNSRGPMAGIYGREEIKGLLSSFFEVWESVVFEPVELIDRPDDRVLQVGHLRTKGHESGAAVGARGATTWAIRDGKIAAVKLYQSKEEALAAEGVSPAS